MIPRILIVGSTGKLGTMLLKYTKKNGISVYASTCFSNTKKIKSQKSLYGIKKTFVLSDSDEKEKFLKILKSKINIIYFLDYGSSSLYYLDIFLKFNQNSLIAIANKEMIIAGGHLLRNKILKSKNNLVPLDSEHFSLFRLR